MINFSAARISKLASTWVGNKDRYEGFSVPRMTCVPVNEVAEELLIGSFAKTFEKSAEMWAFKDLEGNNAYKNIQSTFSDPEGLLPAGAAYLTEDLYNFCTGAKLRGGELFTIYFEDLMVDGSPCSAIGLWKIEGHTPYFKTERTTESNLVTTVEGFAAAKPQVVALILNMGEAEGYRVCAIDTVTKKGQRSFWKDDFMRLTPVNDDYFQTRHHIAVVSEFIDSKLRYSGLTKVETMALMVKAGDYFKDAEEVDIDDLSAHLFPAKEQTDKFLHFRDEYNVAYNVPLADNFLVSVAAVKKEGKLFKSTIKLDDNFVIAPKSRLDLMERCEDEDGRTYYKIFFYVEE
jgi:hypothetical protein